MNPLMMRAFRDELEKIALNPMAATGLAGAGLGAVAGGVRGAIKAPSGQRLAGAKKGALMGGALGGAGGAALGSMGVKPGQAADLVSGLM